MEKVIKICTSGSVNLVASTVVLLDNKNPIWYVANSSNRLKIIE